MSLLGKMYSHNFGVYRSVHFTDKTVEIILLLFLVSFPRHHSNLRQNFALLQETLKLFFLGKKLQDSFLYHLE